VGIKVHVATDPGGMRDNYNIIKRTYKLPGISVLSQNTPSPPVAGKALVILSTPAPGGLDV